MLKNTKNTKENAICNTKTPHSTKVELNIKKYNTKPSELFEYKFFLDPVVDVMSSVTPSTQSSVTPSTQSSVTPSTQPPKRIFIVPYRNRPQQLFFFYKYMSFLLEDMDKKDYEIYFSHQCDARTFNRGATKNIGFLAMKYKYPEHYKNITFIFNDVDTIPFHKIFDYETTKGVVKHYYGYEYALGGIVVIKGEDFERTNGYPCFWGWGMEDNTLQKRCERLQLKLDRSHFYKIGSPEILQLFDGISRIVSKKDPYKMQHDNGRDGLSTIYNLKYSIEPYSANPADNKFVANVENFNYINIKTFMTYDRYETNKYYQYDLRQPPREIINPSKLKEAHNVVITTDDWSNIPYHPTTKETRENVAKMLLANGKKIPPSLLKEIEQDNINELKMDNYNKNIIKNEPQTNVIIQKLISDVHMSLASNISTTNRGGGAGPVQHGHHGHHGLHGLHGLHGHHMMTHLLK